jgi:hypothetical protein
MEEQFTAILAISNTHLFFIRKALELPGLATWSARAPSIEESVVSANREAQRSLEGEALLYGRLVGAYKDGDRKELSLPESFDASLFPWAEDIVHDLLSRLPAVTFNILNTPAPKLEVILLGPSSRVVESAS